MSEFSLIKYKKDEWEHLKEDCDKCVIVGRLEMLNDLTDYMDALKESYTRLLVVNDVDEKKYEIDIFLPIFRQDKIFALYF